MFTEGYYIMLIAQERIENAVHLQSVLCLLPVITLLYWATTHIHTFIPYSLKRLPRKILTRKQHNSLTN